jgi:hypothetical protein
LTISYRLKAAKNHEVASMSFQQTHQSSATSTQTSPSPSQLTPRPFPAQPIQPPLTQEEIENQSFAQDKFEASGLQLKETFGTITPVEQARLGVLQAKMDGFWVQRMERAKAQPNLLEILTRNTQTTQATEPVVASPVMSRVPLSTPNLQPQEEKEQQAELQALPKSASQSPGSTTLQRDAQNAAEPVDYAAEFSSFAAKNAVEGGLEGYKTIRHLLIAKFGSIANANTYYRGVGSVNFVGASPTVHKATLGTQLKKAEDLLKAKGWYDAIAATSPKIGGFNVRPNRNNPNSLSEHSLGFAIDINAKFNPNMNKRFPARAVMAVTGDSVITGDTRTQINAGGTADELLPQLEAIRDTSDTFQQAFTDEASLEQAMRTHLSTHLKFKIDDNFPVLEKVKAAASKGKSGEAARKELVNELKTNLTSLSDLKQWQEAEDREAIVAAKGWKAWEKEKAKRQKAEAKRLVRIGKAQEDTEKKAAKLRAAGKSEAEIAQLVYAPFQASLQKQMDTETTQMINKVSGTLLELWKIYVKTFKGGNLNKGVRVPAKTEGDAGSVAAHGFMNLSSELATALISSDGGNLHWLGAASVLDFMHFELKPSERPSMV